MATTPILMVELKFNPSQSKYLKRDPYTTIQSLLLVPYRCLGMFTPLLTEIKLEQARDLRHGHLYRTSAISYG